MKTQFLTLAITLMSLFTISSSFNKVYSQIPVSVSGAVGDCSFTGTAVLALSNDGQNVVATGTFTGWITDNNGTPTDPTDDVMEQVSGTVNETVTLDGTTCTSLSITPLGSFDVAGDCGTIPLAFGDAYYASKQGGRLNLITNSLCAIARYYDNGQKASINSLFAHVDNFMRAITR